MFDYETQKRVMVSLGEASSLLEVLAIKLQSIDLPETDYEILSLIDQANNWNDRMNKLRDHLEKYSNRID